MWKLRLSVMAIVWLLSSIRTDAVCGQPSPRVCAEFFRSDVVLSGTVVSVRDWPATGANIEGWFYRVKVTRSYRGPAREFVEVFTGNDSARLPLVNGRSYLLFAREYGGRLTIGNCGNSAELSEAAESIHQIETVLENMKSASGGDIGGRIVVGPGDARPVGITVTARRGDKKYSGITDETGSFHIHVPPGRYAVWPETSQWTVTPYDLSYDNEDHVVVERGGCAELQFMAAPK